MTKAYTINMLKWKRVDWPESNVESIAQTDLYHYLIGETLDGEWFYTCEGYRKEYTSEKAAKQGAQEHWELRLQEALGENTKRYDGLPVCVLCEEAMSPEEANRWEATRAIAEQALSVMVMDLGYTSEPLYGHSPMRHQLMWKHIVDVLGEEKVEQKIKVMAEQSLKEAVPEVDTDDDQSQKRYNELRKEEYILQSFQQIGKERLSPSDRSRLVEMINVLRGNRKGGALTNGNK